MTLIPPHYLDAVGVIESADLSTDPVTFTPIATGTLLGYKTDDQNGVPEGQYRRVLILATNRHVVEGETDLWIRFNQGASSERFRLAVKDEDGTENFITHPDYDVAISAIDGEKLVAAGAEFSALPSFAFLDLAGLEQQAVVGGDGIFVLGFPMGIAGIERKYAIVRGGVIARVDHEIVDQRKSFLIDCPVFPGNSGGPVILKPELLSVDGPGRSRVHVIGIVSGYVPWVDIAISQQTHTPRITFEENSGLTNVVPMDAINELVQPLLPTEEEGATEVEELSQGESDEAGDS